MEVSKSSSRSENLRLWTVTCDDEGERFKSAKDAPSDDMTCYRFAKGSEGLTVSVHHALADDERELVEFACAMARYSSRTEASKANNVFTLAIQSRAVLLFNKDIEFHRACEIVYIASGCKLRLAAGPHAQKFFTAIDECQIDANDAVFPEVAEMVTDYTDNCGISYGPLKLTYVDNDLVGIDGDYVARHAELGGYNPFAKDDIPIAQRAVTAVQKMASVDASEVHFYKNAYQAYFDAAVVGVLANFEDASVLGESVEVYALRQRFVTWAGLSLIAERQKFLQCYWSETQVTVLGRKASTYYRFSQGLDKFKEVIDKYVPKSREGSSKRSKEIAAIRGIMAESYKTCPITKKGVSFVGSDVLYHFYKWTEKTVGELMEEDPTSLEWPRADFSCIEKGSGISLGNDIAKAISECALNQRDYRKCRAIFVLPDYFGKFASLETMMHGKPYTVINKWGFLSDLEEGRYDLYGVGSENYFLSVLPECTIKGLRNKRTHVVVTFFDNDEAMVRRFFYAEKGDVLDPRPNDFIVSDAECEYELDDLAKIFRAAQQGVALKLLLKHDGFWRAVQACVNWSRVKQWRFKVQKCGDLYNGEFIFLAGRWKVIGRKSDPDVSPSLDSIAVGIVESVTRGEYNRRKSLMLFILGVAFSPPSSARYARFLRFLRRHRANRNYFVATSKATATYLR